MKPVEEIAQWIADRKCRGLNDPDTEGCPAQPDQCECEMLDAIAAALRAERERADAALTLVGIRTETAHEALARAEKAEAERDEKVTDLFDRLRDVEAERDVAESALATAEAERDAARGELANWKLGSDMADWSALPRDLYVTNARAIDHIGWQVTLCSVPMAIGPEVRYVRADALARAEAERDEARALYEAADKQLGLHLNGTVHEALQDLVRDADARAATARNRALEEGYLAGFLASGEGWNGEYPGDAHEQPYWTKRRDEELAALRTKEGE